MPFVPIPNTCKAEMLFTYDGQQVENVYHVQSTSNPDETELTSIAVIFVGWWNTTMRPIMPNTLTLRAVLVTDLNSSSGLAIEYNASPLPLTGASGQAQLPNNATLAIKWTTNFRGRSFRGRTFHLGLLEENVVGNTVGSSGASAFKALYQALIDAATSNGHQLVVASTISNGAPRSPGISTLITGLSVDPIVDSQRRRLPGRGS